jgi:glycosyltransferase involved in cell wall biosynthesis
LTRIAEVDKVSRVRISVITPAYNAAAYIGRAIDSALAQSHPVHEIVVVDDGSRDDTASIVSAFGPPVRLIRQVNGGASAARNAAVNAATGDWLAFLDADDAFAPDKLALQADVIDRNPGVKIVYGGARLLSGGKEIGQLDAFPAQELWPALRYRSPILPSTVLLEREAFLRVGGFDTTLPVAEDWDLWLKLHEAYSSGAFFGLQRVVSDYLVTDGSLSSNPMRLFETKLGLLDRRLLRDTSGLNRAIWRRRILAFFHIDAALALREQGDPRCFDFAARSIALWPFVSKVLPARRYATFLSMLKGRLRSRRLSRP